MANFSREAWVRLLFIARYTARWLSICRCCFVAQDINRQDTYVRNEVSEVTGVHTVKNRREARATGMRMLYPTGSRGSAF